MSKAIVYSRQRINTHLLQVVHVKSAKKIACQSHYLMDLFLIATRAFADTKRRKQSLSQQLLKDSRSGSVVRQSWKKGIGGPT
jgi:hypothetical protein